jgi:hypothetical protein
LWEKRRVYDKYARSPKVDHSKGFFPEREKRGKRIAGKNGNSFIMKHVLWNAAVRWSYKKMIGAS